MKTIIIKMKHISNFLIFIVLFFCSNCNFAQTKDTIRKNEREIIREYFVNGNIKSEKCIINKQLHGESTYYNEKGDVIEKALYNKNIIINRKVFENGNLILFEVYDGGLLVYESKYDIKGIIGYERIQNHNGSSFLIFYEDGKFKNSTEQWSK